ncbi:hypothetical protein SAMN02799622_05416 [Methylobacterium sp. UNC378MF]|nr:hypothetical protein SAMN02799622_05416 [Methylobacterium sp. UNC378MF]
MIKSLVALHNKIFAERDRIRAKGSAPVSPLFILSAVPEIARSSLRPIWCGSQTSSLHLAGDASAGQPLEGRGDGGTGDRKAPAHGRYRRCDAIQLGAKTSPASVMIQGCASPASIASTAATSAARKVEKWRPFAVCAGLRLDQRVSSAGLLRSDGVMDALRSMSGRPVLSVSRAGYGLQEKAPSLPRGHVRAWLTRNGCKRLKPQAVLGCGRSTRTSTICPVKGLGFSMTASLWWVYQ